MTLRRKLKILIKSPSGFTMMELITVIVVIALLAVLIIPGYLHFIDDAKKDAAIAEARTIYMAAQIRSLNPPRQRKTPTVSPTRTTFGSWWGRTTFTRALQS